MVRDPGRPVVFMHIPKTGGTAFGDLLQSTIAPARVLRGFDRCLFGAFDGFGTMTDAERADIYLDPAGVPGGASLAMAHMSRSTLNHVYPAAQFVTVLREPYARLLSFWSYWRRLATDGAVGMGNWGKLVERSRRPLAEFLADPLLACQTDNLTARMLLWPDARIPDADFIDPADDDGVFELAVGHLARFAFVDLAERSALAGWLGTVLAPQRLNETSKAATHMPGSLADELTPAALARMSACSRIDLRLWCHIACASMPDAEATRIRTETLMSATARHAALM